MEEMIQEFKRAYIRKYKISQDYVVRYPDEKLSNEDELEGGGLADLMGPQRETHPKDSERGGLKGPCQRGPPRRRELGRPAHRISPEEKKRKQ